MTTAREQYEIQVTLHDGRVVGSWSQDWLLECEARHLLGLPLAERRQALLARFKLRGEASVNALKMRMLSIHSKRKPTVA